MPKNVTICPRFDVRVDGVDYFCDTCRYHVKNHCVYRRPRYDKKEAKKRLYK